MKIFRQSPASLLIALTGIASADVPEKVSPARYEGLWLRSPFTSPIGKDAPKPEVDPFGDYALIGVSPLGGEGFRVTLINKAQSEKRITLDSGMAKEGISVLGVDHKEGDPLGTVVRMKIGSKTGDLRFDTKFLALTTTKAASRQPDPSVQSRPQTQSQLKAPDRSASRPRVLAPNP